MSEKIRIYWTSVEFKLKNSHPDFNTVMGGMVYAFIKCRDAETALLRFKEELDKLHLIPFDFEFIKPYDDIEWENDKDTKCSKGKLNEALNSENVILDDFYMYENE
jgi:hypothetical protein